MSLCHVAWQKGGQGTIESLQGDAIVIVSTTPSPPGSRIDGQLTGRNGEAGPTLRVKIHSSKKQSDGSFLLEGRALDMTRQVRTFIVAEATPQN